MKRRRLPREAAADCVSRKRSLWRAALCQDGQVLCSVAASFEMSADCCQSCCNDGTHKRLGATLVIQPQPWPQMLLQMYLQGKA